MATSTTRKVILHYFHLMNLNISPFCSEILLKTNLQVEPVCVNKCLTTNELARSNTSL